MDRKDKYSVEFSKAADVFIPSSLPKTQADLIRASISTSTWSKHLSAIHCLKEFQIFSKKNLSEFPLSEQTICEFVSFALTKKKLKHTTVQSYLASLKFFHNLRNCKNNACENFMAKTMIKGAKNLDLYSSISKNCRKAMSFPLLKILSHQIAKENFTAIDKQVIWTLFTVAFFGSFRFGELLPNSRKIFNSKETLLWSDITFKDDFVVFRLKLTKTKKTEYVDLFLQPDCKYCPVKALSRLKKLQIVKNPDMPVFTLQNGSFLTTWQINGILQRLLKPVLKESAALITGHSFRAALASAMASQPEVASQADIRMWGRWDSESYLLYTRLKTNQKRAIYKKIMSVLNNKLK
jgi:integrase